MVVVVVVVVVMVVVVFYFSIEISIFSLFLLLKSTIQLIVARQRDEKNMENDNEMGTCFPEAKVEQNGYRLVSVEVSVKYF